MFIHTNREEAIQLPIGHKRVLLQPICWRCVECVIHHERDVREEQHHMYVLRTSNNRVIMACELHCCLLQQCEALHTCSGFPIATVPQLHYVPPGT